LGKIKMSERQSSPYGQSTCLVKKKSKTRLTDTKPSQYSSSIQHANIRSNGLQNTTHNENNRISHNGISSTEAITKKIG
jgi:hypothetical protein